MTNTPERISQVADTETTVWYPCPDCEDYLCAIHNVHAHDCSCPTIETWCEDGMLPYDEPVTQSIRDWVARHPLEE